MTEVRNSECGVRNPSGAGVKSLIRCIVTRGDPPSQATEDKEIKNIKKCGIGRKVREYNHLQARMDARTAKKASWFQISGFMFDVGARTEKAMEI